KRLFAARRPLARALASPGDGHAACRPAAQPTGHIPGVRAAAQPGRDRLQRPWPEHPAAQPGRSEPGGRGRRGTPRVLFAMLDAQGITAAATQALPDHYDFESFSRKLENDKPLICTEKDAVK